MAVGFSISIWYRPEDPANVRSTGQSKTTLTTGALELRRLVPAMLVLATPQVLKGRGAVYGRLLSPELGTPHLVSLSISTVPLGVSAHVPSLTASMTAPVIGWPKSTDDDPASKDIRIASQTVLHAKLVNVILVPECVNFLY